MQTVKKYAPGVALCLAIAVPCLIFGTWVPVVGGPVFAILIGMVISLFFRQKGAAQAGIGFTSKKILQLAVILLGFGLNLSQIAEVGLSSLPVILSTITTSLVVAFVLCKTLKVPGKTATLIGVGSSICGGSAIAATAPVIKADDEEIAQSISVIFLFNVIAALIFPTLGTLFGMNNEGFALFAGTAVNDTSSVTAAASTWDAMHPGADTLSGATIVKLTRTLAIIPITLGLAVWNVVRAKRAGAASGAGESGFSLKKSFPMFILFFLLASVITTVTVALGVDSSFYTPVKDLSKFFIIMAMAAVGLNTDLVKLIKNGGKPILLGFCCWIAIAAVSLLVQRLLGIW